MVHHPFQLAPMFPATQLFHVADWQVIEFHGNVKYVGSGRGNIGPPFHATTPPYHRTRIAQHPHMRRFIGHHRVIQFQRTHPRDTAQPLVHPRNQWFFGSCRGHTMDRHWNHGRRRCMVAHDRLVLYHAFKYVFFSVYPCNAVYPTIHGLFCCVVWIVRFARHQTVCVHWLKLGGATPCARPPNSWCVSTFWTLRPRQTPTSCC